MNNKSALAHCLSLASVLVFSMSCRWGQTSLLKDDPLATVTVDTRYGSVEGFEAEQFLDDAGHARAVYSFRGIPYASPPVGDRRWAPPQAPTPWRGRLDATEFSAECAQPESSLFDPSEQEDCLYLNVWTSDLSPGASNAVMVWIHGGGYTLGSGSRSTVDGTQLAKRGVVVVTLNYRLGPFGFFAHPELVKKDNYLGGNFGLMDQAHALKWVRDNITEFGGDAENVTIFGESAGGGSVGFQMILEDSRGLFHRAISQSGHAMKPARYIDRDGPTPDVRLSMFDVARELASRLDCEADRELACLRNKSASEILEAAKPALGLIPDSGRTRFWPFVDYSSISEQPLESFRTGRQHPVPYMLGANANETTLFGEPPVRTVLGYRLLLRALFDDRADAIFDLFPARTFLDVPAAYDQLVTHYGFMMPARRIAKLMDRAGGRAFVYHFSRVSPYLEDRGMGATHGAEIAYIFEQLQAQIDRAGDDSIYGSRDFEVSSQMSQRWVSFAKTGSPNAPGFSEWRQFSEFDDTTFVFGHERTGAERDFCKDACDLLEEISE